MRRRRQPGFYVSVRLAAAVPVRLPSELLDGPWPTHEAASARAREIEEQRKGQGALVSVVRVEEDGMTLVRDEEG